VATGPPNYQYRKIEIQNQKEAVSRVIQGNVVQETNVYSNPEMALSGQSSQRRLVPSHKSFISPDLPNNPFNI